jgi:hypothetical protein
VLRPSFNAVSTDGQPCRTAKPTKKDPTSIIIEGSAVKFEAKATSSVTLDAVNKRTWNIHEIEFDNTNRRKEYSFMEMILREPSLHDIRWEKLEKSLNLIERRIEVKILT